MTDVMNRNCEQLISAGFSEDQARSIAATVETSMAMAPRSPVQLVSGETVGEPKHEKALNQFKIKELQERLENQRKLTMMATIGLVLVFIAAM